MKKQILSVFLFFVIFSNHLFSQEVNILVIMPQNYGANYNFNMENFDEFGWNVTTTGITRTIQPCPSFASPSASCQPITVDTLISEIEDVTQFDCVAIMPSNWRIGNAYIDLVNSQAALDLISTAVDSGVIVWATCAGVRVLAVADVIDGKHVVTQDAFRSEIEAAGGIFMGSDHPPIIDGNIVTTVRGQYYHVQNIEAIATALEIKHSPAKRALKKTGASPNSISYDVKQSNALWTKTFGGFGPEAGRAICETVDRGFIIAGYTYSFGMGYSDGYVIKVDSEGNKEWENTFGGSGWEYGYAVTQTQDEGFVVVGYTTSFGSGLKDVYVIKLGSAGEKLWEKTYGGADVDVGKAVCEMSDGALMICGYTKSFGNGEEDVYLIKLSSGGDELWSTTFGRNRSEMATSICQTTDGNVVIAGATGSEPFSSGNMDFYIIKIDMDGNQLWEKAHGNSISAHPYDWGNSVFKKSDGGFIIAGNSDIRSPLDVYVVSTDGDGNRLWQKNYGERFYDYAISIKETKDGGFLICGAKKNNVTEDKNVYVIKTDSAGNEIWAKTFGGDGADWGSAICETKDGSYVIVGHTKSFGAGNFDVWLLKISSLFPRFNAAPTTGHAPLTVEFSDLSLGDATGWQWDFNSDGTVDSEEQSPSWIFEQPGNYDVTFCISNVTQSDTIIHKNLVQVFDGESALAFNGVSSKIVCPASASLNITENLTIEAWINPENWGPNSMIGFGRIVEKQQFAMYLIDSSPAFNDHSVAFQISHVDGPRSISMTPENSIQLDVWQHIALTYAGNSNEVKMYINGIEQSVNFTVAPAGFIADNSANDFVIGNTENNAYGFKGKIDEVRIWNSVLSAQQIYDKMNGHYIIQKPGLIGCWGMNEGNGNVVLDISSHGNDGTIINANWCQGLSLAPTSSGKLVENNLPDNLMLYENYPNPFNPETTISFFLPISSPVKIVIYSVTGTQIKTLLNENNAAGFFEMKWDGTDEQGNQVSSGVYFYKLTGADGFSATKKMLLLK